MTEGLSFKETRLAEVGGKPYVLSICADDRVPEEHKEIIQVACSGSQTLKKW